MLSRQADIFIPGSCLMASAALGSAGAPGRPSLPPLLPVAQELKSLDSYGADAATDQCPPERPSPWAGENCLVPTLGPHLSFLLTPAGGLVGVQSLGIPMALPSGRCRARPRPSMSTLSGHSGLTGQVPGLCPHSAHTPPRPCWQEDPSGGGQRGREDVNIWVRRQDLGVWEEAPDLGLHTTHGRHIPFLTSHVGHYPRVPRTSGAPHFLQSVARSLAWHPDPM